MSFLIRTIEDTSSGESEDIQAGNRRNGTQQGVRKNSFKPFKEMAALVPSKLKQTLLEPT